MKLMDEINTIRCGMELIATKREDLKLDVVLEEMQKAVNSLSIVCVQIDRNNEISRLHHENVEE